MEKIKRDTKSGAVLVTDSIALDKYKNAKRILKQKNNKIEEMEERLNRLEALLLEQLNK